MKTLIALLLFTFTFSHFTVSAQEQTDTTFIDGGWKCIHLNEIHHVNRITNTGHFTLSITLTNTTTSDFKYIEYAVRFITFLGDDEGGIILQYEGPVKAGKTLVIPKQYLKCPGNCWNIRVVLLGEEEVK